MSYNEKKFWEILINNSIEKSKFCINEWYRFNYNLDCSLSKSCICTKEHLKHVFYIKNKLNNNELIIGSDCIKKYFSNIYLKIIKDQEQLKKDLKKLILDFNTLRKEIVYKLSKIDIDRDDINKVINDINYRSWLSKLHNQNKLYGKAKKQYDYYTLYTNFNDKDFNNFNFELHRIKFELLNLNCMSNVTFKIIE